MNNKPEIYVACPASYVNGVLHGRWIDATLDRDEVYAAISEMLDESPEPGAEEWAIHDYDGFGDLRLGEYEDLSRVCVIARLIEEYGALAIALLLEFSYCVEEAARILKSGDYLGPYDSVEDYVREMVESRGDVPVDLLSYIDYSSMAYDVKIESFVLEVEQQVYIVLY